MDSNWERSVPYYIIDKAIAEQLIHRFDRKIQIDSLSLLPQGKRNTNYLITCRNFRLRYLLRIFGADDDWWEKEGAVNSLVSGLVPVPRLYFLSPPVPEIEKPYAIYEFLDGETLDIHTAGSQKVQQSIFSKLGEYLSRLHEIRYTSVGFFDKTLQRIEQLPPLESWYGMFLGTSARAKLGPALSDRVEKYVADNMDVIKAIQTRKTLVHGDFRPTNIMVKQGSVQGIIDWEWAMAGHPIADIGQFLRYEKQVNGKQEKIFMESYNHNASEPFTAGYKKMARVRDLINLIQMLNTEIRLPYKDDDMKNLIARTTYHG